MAEENEGTAEAVDETGEGQMSVVGDEQSEPVQHDTMYPDAPLGSIQKVADRQAGDMALESQAAGEVPTTAVEADLALNGDRDSEPTEYGDDAEIERREHDPFSPHVPARVDGSAPVDKEINEEARGRRARDESGDLEPEEVVEGTVSEVKEFLEDHPEKTAEVLEAEAAAAKEEGREPRKTLVTEDREYDAALLEILEGDVKSVNEHLDEYDGDRERMLELEAAGKSRKGIVEGPHASQPEDDSADNG